MHFFDKPILYILEFIKSKCKNSHDNGTMLLLTTVLTAGQEKALKHEK